MERPLPSPDALVAVLDDIFRRILRDGERGRADRGYGPPPWTPEPQVDFDYHGIEVEGWNSVPYPPQIWIQELEVAVMTNCVQNARPFIDDALRAHEIDLSPKDAVWPIFSRLALIAAARAHVVDARREWADYSDGWPQSAGIPACELPGNPATVAPARSEDAAVAADATVKNAGARDGTTPSRPMLSEMFERFLSRKAGYTDDYRKQARGALDLFVSLMDDLPVNTISGEIAETFRDRLRKLPAERGRGIYAGMTPVAAMTFAEKLRTQLRDGTDPIRFGKMSLTRAAAEKFASPLSMKTVNKYFTVFTSWGTWMEKDDERGTLLHRHRSPFAGRAFSKAEVASEARRAGRARTPFRHEDLQLLFATPLFLDPPPLTPSNDPAVQLHQAKFWSILIGLYTGMRLGEIGMLRPSDLRREEDVYILDLRSDRERSFKTEAGDRKIPLHPKLLRLRLPEFISASQRVGLKLLFPAAKMSADSYQQAANLSKWFTRWRRQQGVDSVRTPFHAFRHSFETELKARLPGSDTLIDQIVGHKPSSVGAKHYTATLPVSSKFEAISRIDYHIDLSQIEETIDRQSGPAGMQ